MKEICGCFICGAVFVNHGLEDGQLLLGIYSENNIERSVSKNEQS